MRPRLREASGGTMTLRRWERAHVWTGLLAIVIALLPVASPVQAAESASFEGLPLAPADVNASGTVVVGTSNFRAARWVDGTLTDLGLIFSATCGASGTARSSMASGVNADGGVVVGTSTEVSIRCVPDITHAFRWTASTGITELVGLPVQNGGGPRNTAADVNADGTVIVGSSLHSNGGSTPCFTEAFRWVNGTI